MHLLSPRWPGGRSWLTEGAGSSSSPGGLLPRGPHQNRTRRFPPSGSSADVAHGDAPQIRTRIRGTGRGYRSNNATNLGQGSTTFRISGDMSPDVNAPVMGPFESSHQHGPPLLGRVRGPTRSPTSSLVCSPPTPSLPSAAAPVVPGRWPTCPSATRRRRKKGLPGAWAVLFQRAVGSDPAGCASRLAHRVETAIAFRLHNALGTQNERYFVAVNPTAHSLACLRIGVFVTADAARLATGVGGSPFTGRVSHPLDGEQSFMTSPHRHSPLTSLAWSHRAPTPPAAGAQPACPRGCRPTGGAVAPRTSVGDGQRLCETASSWRLLSGGGCSHRPYNTTRREPPPQISTVRGTSPTTRAVPVEAPSPVVERLRCSPQPGRSQLARFLVWTLHPAFQNQNEFSSASHSAFIPCVSTR